MQYELKTQVIDPQRKTFTHLIKRFGDRPASRYEEGTIDIQAVENFHYRPTWAPDKELYDPAYSAFLLTDPYSFTDPRQYFYTPYVTTRSGMHEAFGKTLDYVETRNLVDRTPEAWRAVMAECFLPLRHLESGAQMLCSGAARFSYGTTIAQCCAYAGFDRIGNAQLISRVGITLGGGNDELLKTAKQSWIDDEPLQPLRRVVEELLVEDDWAVGMVGLDMVDQLVYGLFYRHLDEEALLGGAGAYSLVAQHLAGWFKDHRRWVDALYKAWLADEQHGESNKQHLASAVQTWLPRAEEAVLAVATRVDEHVDAGAAAAVPTITAEVRESFSALGLSEVSA